VRLVNLDKVVSQVNEFSVDHKVNVFLKKASYFLTGGVIRISIYPKNIVQLQKVINFLGDSKLSFYIFGATTNSVFCDNTDLDIVIFTGKLNCMKLHEGKMEFYAEAGSRLPKLCNELLKKSITGFEELHGIPGTIGGAVFMNAGCYGNDISKNLICVDYIDKDGLLKTVQRGQCGFGYRKSIFQKELKGVIIVGARFKYSFSHSNDIIDKMEKFHKHRHKFLEYSYRNVGSIFVTHDIYMELAKRHIPYRVLLFFMRVFFHKIFRIKTNKYLNYLTFFYFGLMDYMFVVSEWTMNVAVNRGHKTSMLVEYIEEIKRLTNFEIEVEIQVI
jgi:UDP-N-acetylmuramate dehydrogenase